MNYIKNSGNRPLRFITCGSVDDGKSTLIGNMLFESKLLYLDQEKTLKTESKIHGRNGRIDYSLLLDGLTAEREQKITIDVAYRFFSTNRRSFIVADTPGHEEYTRNMAVGASFAELAVILVDSTKGILSQTMRHVRICSLMGIKYLVFAVNKMDLVSYREDIYQQIAKSISEITKELELHDTEIIPVSATEGDNVSRKSNNMPWYLGKTMLEYLETVEIKHSASDIGFIMPVQRICRPDQLFRGIQGHVESGEIELNDEIMVLPSGERAIIQEIYLADRLVTKVKQGQPATIRLNREIDISRGSVVSNSSKLRVAKAFRATILWMDESKLIIGKEVFLKMTHKTVPAIITRVICKIEPESNKKLEACEGKKNDILVCELRLNESIVCMNFDQHKTMGGFILIDRVSKMTIACGRIDSIDTKDRNVVHEVLEVSPAMRATHMLQCPATLWFTGLSGAGKSTIANAVEKKLFALGRYTMLLDGDNIRLGLCRDLSFKKEDRIENNRRIAEVAKLINDAGLIVLVACISPYCCEREEARKTIGDNKFYEIYVNTPLSECEKRDKKGLYKKAKRGEISNFTGIDSPYEPPKCPDLIVNTKECSIDMAAQLVVDMLVDKKIIF